MSRHLSKLFDSLCKLKFRLDAEGKPLKFGLGMYSKEDEYVDFDKECDLSGQVSPEGRWPSTSQGNPWGPLCNLMYKCSYLYWGLGWGIVCKWSSKEKFQESVLSSHRVGPGDRTHVTRLGSKHLYLLSHLTDPNLVRDFVVESKHTAFPRCVAFI